MMNTRQKSDALTFLRGIEPLDFDPELVEDYIQTFQSDDAKGAVMGELECLYDELENKGDRLKLMRLLTNLPVFSDC